MIAPLLYLYPAAMLAPLLLDCNNPLALASMQLQLQQETQQSITVQLDLDQCHTKLQDVENEKNAKIANLENQLLLAEKNHKKKML